MPSDTVKLDPGERGRVQGSGDGDLDYLFGASVLWTLIRLRIHFSGTTGVAGLTMAHMTGAGDVYDTQMARWSGAGKLTNGSGDVDLRIQEEDILAWTFEPSDAIRLAWTNPNAGSTNWGVTADLMGAVPSRSPANFGSHPPASFGEVNRRV